MEGTASFLRRERELPDRADVREAEISHSQENICSQELAGPFQTASRQHPSHQDGAKAPRAFCRPAHGGTQREGRGKKLTADCSTGF